MKPSDQTFVLPGKDALETWRASAVGPSTRQEASKAKSAQWIGLPMRSVVSVPMRFTALAPDRREAAALLELEGLGMHPETSDFQVRTHGNDDAHRDQRAWTVVQTPNLPSAATDAQMDASFAPSAAFRTMKGGEVQMWHESGHLTVAIPDEAGHTLHAQALSAVEADEDAAAELRCIFAALDLAGMAPEVKEIVIQQPADAMQPAESFTPFAHAAALPVSTEAQPAPRIPTSAWRLVPPPIVQRRIARRQQQTMMLSGLGVVIVILALLGAFAGRLWTRERALAVETRRLNAMEPDLNLIREAQARWDLLQPAIEPGKAAVEAYHQICQLLPPEGIRMETFEIREGHIILDGVASTHALYGEFRDKLKSLATLSHLSWDTPLPQNLPDGTAKFHADGGPPVSEEGAAQ